MSVHVVDAPARQRFEAVLDDRVVGFAAYQKTAELVVFTHTEVASSLEGQGVGGALVHHALEHARGLGLQVLPICPFVPSTQDGSSA